MSDRPEWMPSEFDLDQTSYQIGVTDHDSGTVALCRMVYDTGLRAQIAVLEEMLPLTCPDCAAGEPDDGSFNHWEGRQCSEDEWEQVQYECRASALREKIAALRKELEG